MTARQRSNMLIYKDLRYQVQTDRRANEGLQIEIEKEVRRRK